MEHSTQLALEWFSTEGFMPHGHCYLWTPGLLWTFVITESVIVLAYFSIPFALLYLVRKRTDLSFNWIFKLFSAFIFACGITHLLDIWTIWHADYWLDAMTRVITATLSVTAAVLLFRLIPQTLKLPSTQQLEDANAQLQAEIARCEAVEIELAALKDASDTRFQTLFEDAPVGVAEVDLDTGKFLLINQKCCDLIGYSREEILQLDFKYFTHPDDILISQDKIRAVRDKQISSYTIDKRYLHKDGHTIWATLTASRLDKPDESQSTFLVTLQDITARKLAEEYLQEKLDELERWHAATLGRETRVLELKREVNELLLNSGQPPRYASAAGDGD